LERQAFDVFIMGIAVEREGKELEKARREAQRRRR
jgi:hypothetical protein